MERDKKKIFDQLYVTTFKYLSQGFWPEMWAGELEGLLLPLETVQSEQLAESPGSLLTSWGLHVMHPSGCEEHVDHF